MDSNSIKEALEAAYDLERELDADVEARVEEFTRMLWEIIEGPDAKRKLDFIERLINDQEFFDATVRKLGIVAI
jgi:hypothetical protein